MNPTALEKSLLVIENSSMVYLTTINDQNYPETRAMLNLRNNKQYPQLQKLFSSDHNSFEIFFTTNTSSSKVKQIITNNKASAYYCIPEQFKGVWISGDLEILDNVAKMKYWVSGWEMYYPGGKTDLDFTILKMKPKSIKGYENFSTYIEHFRN